MNITKARQLAQKSTQHGYFDQSGLLWVDCPLRRDGNCASRPSVQYNMWATDGKGKRLSKIQQLRQEVFDHLRYEHS